MPRKTPKRIGLAIIGAGRVGLFRGEVAARHPQVDFIGIAETKPDRAREVAEKTHADFVTADFRELLARPEVTAAIINQKIIPTHSTADVQHKITAPDVASITGQNLKVLAGTTCEDQFFQERPKEQKRQPAELKIDRIGGTGVVYCRWYVTGQGPYTVTLVTNDGTYSATQTFLWTVKNPITFDPTDDQTFWTFQEYANADNSWGVRVIQLKAPPPVIAAPVGAPASRVNDTVWPASGSVAVTVNARFTSSATV